MDERQIELRQQAEKMVENHFMCPDHNPEDHMLTANLTSVLSDLYVAGFIYIAVVDVDEQLYVVEIELSHSNSPFSIRSYPS